MAPGFFAIHPVEHLSPEEDILLLDISFMSTTPEATMHVPSYAEWLEKTDQKLAYSYAVKLLKLLQWQRPGKRWVLKSPHHLEFFDLVNQEYNQVHYLWTHRSVLTCIPSFLSMIAHSRSIFSDDVRPEEIKSHWVRKTGYMLSKALAFRQKAENDRNFLDIHYDHFIQHPIEAVQKIYQRLGPIDETLSQIFHHTEKKNTAHKYGRHHYDMKDFGVAPEEIEQHTKTYQDFIVQLTNTNH